MKELDLKLISAEQTLFQGNVLYVKLPGTEGNFSIHPSHAPLVSSLKQGDIIYQTGKDGLKSVTISGGFLEVNHNSVTVCVEI